MSFDPATLITTAFLTLLLFGLALATVVRRSRADAGVQWWITSFLMGASGFLVLLTRPTAVDDLLLIVANTLFVTAYACGYGGARALTGRRPSVWTLAAGAIAWPLIIGLWNPPFDSRIIFSSLLIAGFSAAMAFELVRGATHEERHRRIAAAVCAAHAVFFALRALAGPTLGFLNVSAADVISPWGAVIALEIILFSGTMAILIVSISLERARLEERSAAHTDFLTGVGSRRAFERSMARILRAVDDHIPATLLTLDLDGFKKVNDQLGHEAGDLVLKEFAEAVRRELPQPKQFWRLGGDEFAVLLSGHTLRQGDVMKDILRRAIDTSAAIQQTTAGTPVSVSIGIAALLPEETISDLVRRADIALYKDKRRNRAPGSVLASVGRPSFAA